MVRSIEFTDTIDNALSGEDWSKLERVMRDVNKFQGRRDKKHIINEIYQKIISYAIEKNKPVIVLSLPDIPSPEIDELFSRIVVQFIKTNDEAWLDALYSLAGKLGKKSYRSRIFSLIAYDLIDAGVSASNKKLIDHGMAMLAHIGFRKYRSDIIIDIVPLLIVWINTTRDKNLLYTSFTLIEEIGDVSKRSTLHAELTKSLATIAILEKNCTLFFDSLLSATRIHQKVRRQECISFLIDRGAKSVFGKEMTDIRAFMQNIPDIPHEVKLEIIGALSDQLLDRIKDKKQACAILTGLCEDLPHITRIIALVLLKKAERSGDLFYLSSAMDLQEHISDSEIYPIREIVKAGISVAQKSNNMQVLSSLVPFIDKQCNTAVSSRIYLKFSQIMLSAGDFSSALEIFGKISQQPESNSQYTESLLCLIKEAVNKDNIALIRDIILQRLDRDIVQHAIYKTVIDICQEYSFEALIKHIHSFTDLTLFHNRSDQLFLDGIRLLVERGFLTSYDPSILIRLADTIKDSSIREQAISNIVTKIAQIGVRTKNRDYLQRAVGLTVEIDEQSTRSTTLSSIIDEASILAAQQADLDLLLRMKAWSASLLDTNLADYAMANIIQGIIKYAAVKISPEALEEAFIIAKEINDPSLRSQLIEHIAECFVKVGCINLRDNKSYITVSDFSSAFYPFERGLAIIKQNHKSPQISLKIAGIIDIIISQSRISDNPDFIIPLALYSNEIENPFERNAMMSRIISNIDDSVHHPDSTDPYEIMVYFLQRNKYAKSVPVVLNLIYSILQKISNPYVRLSGLGNLADSLIKIHDFRHANNIFDSIHKSIPNLPAEYQKVLMLCDLTMLYCRIDREKAKKCLNEALEKLDKVEPDNISIVHRQVVSSIVSIYAIDSDEQWINVALRIITRIVDPIEYIYSLIIVNSIIKEDPARFHDLLRHMIDAIENIHSPYEKAAVILDIIPLTLKHRDIHTSEVLLKKANALTKKINIQYIADSIRHDIGRIYFELYKKYGDKKNLTNALAVSQSIYSDDIRLELITEIGQEGTYEEPVYYSKIKTLSEKIITEGVSPTQVASLERLVRSIADRGKEALFFCDLALFYKRAGDEKLSRKMLQSAIKEASIIRPLSRRAYIICDIAMKTYAAGFESDSQGLFDHAIDAATNIRQSSIRDEVFEELGLAMKIMQEIKS